MFLTSMAPKLSSAIVISLAILLCCFASSGDGAPSSGPPDLLPRECLTVPSSQFLSSLRSTVEVLRQVAGIVSQFGTVFRDFRLSNAVSDCLDLLDFSVDELSWSISAAQNPSGKHNSTGDLSSDLRTWLSAALANQETCKDGFEGTSGIVMSVVSGSLNQITSLVTELLTMAAAAEAAKGPGRKLSGDSLRFPRWVKSEDQKLLQVSGVTADLVVAQDGSGNFTKVEDAIAAVPDYGTRRFVIYVKKGVYRENVEIKKKKWNIMMVGDGMDATVISGNRSFVDGWTTFRTATFAVSGRGFIARDMAFENTAGPQKHQAVALRSDSDLSVYYRCAMRGYQDTLYTHTMRQFYRECRISGTVDFIFGDAAVVRASPQQKNTVTAQGRKDLNQLTGFSFQFCNVSADSDLAPSVNSTPTYLGRPWKLYSRTIFMQSYMSNAIRPEGWLEWNGEFALDTLYYGEFMNSGPGAGFAGRVKWPGFHVLNNTAQASNFTVAQFIEGNSWLPSTGVGYTAGLGV
ncbi:hypothetical protein NL676_033690 [Syzygium grande]|nr:hypothetical protein NL676_033690 [Syzygium grande]